MKSLLIATLFFMPCLAFSQWGVAFHESNLPFLGINYQLKNRLRTELRFGVDNYIDLISVEAVLSYDLKKTKDYEFYVGAGPRVFNGDGSAVIPIGFNFYPLDAKKFGFHIELTPIIGEDVLLRGSWGIRYRFLK